MKIKNIKLKIAVVFIIILSVICLIKTNNVYSTEYTSNDIIYTVTLNNSNNTATITSMDIGSDTTEIIIPSTMSIEGKTYTVTTIEGLRYNSRIENVLIPSTVTRIDNMTTTQAPKYMTVEAGNPVYSSQDGVLFNKDKTKLIRYPFNNETSYTIPNSVTTIGEGAFYKSHLTKLVMPNSVTTIENNAFEDCRYLVEMNISSNLQTIGSDVFTGVNLNNDIIWPDSLQTIGEGAFRNSSFMIINIPASVTSIGQNAFESSRVKEINVNSENKNYSSTDGVLFNKQKTELIYWPIDKEGAYTIPETVTKIDDKAFAYSKISHITLNENIQQIGAGAFKSSKLSKIEMPKNSKIKVIAEDTFSSCQYLYIVNLSENIETIGARAFENCKTLSTIEIPRSVKSIENTAFKGYTGKFIGYAGSVAEQYAQSNNITFIPKQVTKYTVKFVVEGKETTLQVEEGMAATPPQVQERVGYTFSWDKNFSNITSDLVVNGRYVPNINTPYKVEHYKQNENLNGYTKVQTEDKNGTTGSRVEAVSKQNEYTGFTENTAHPQRIQSGEIKPDGSLVLRLYYDRNTYTVTLNKNGGIIEGTELTSYAYGVGVALPTNITKPGYIFDGWYKDNTFTGNRETNISTTDMGNKTYYAKWVARTDIPYIIEHYKQDANLSTYTKEIENKTGQTGATVEAVARNNYTGFTENTNHSQRVQRGVVTADGKLVLKLYYDRNRYTVTLNKNGGTISGSELTSYVYGIEETLPTNITKPGYNFVGWYDNANFNGNTITKIQNGETNNKTYYAKWVEEEQYYISSEKYTIEGNHITRVKPNTTVTSFINSFKLPGVAKVIGIDKKELSGNSYVGTCCKLQVDYKNNRYEYDIAVRGDLDGNGKITITDLSTLNSIYVNKKNVEEIRKKAADLDYSGKITITDISMMNQAIVEKKEL